LHTFPIIINETTTRAYNRTKYILRNKIQINLQNLFP